MADDYNSFIFPLMGETIFLRICYQETNQLKTKIRYNLDFKFKIVQSSFYLDDHLITYQWPSVKSLSNELKKAILEKVLPLLGKNMQVTSLLIRTERTSFTVYLYEFGTGSHDAVPPDTSLYFILQSSQKGRIHRFYLKGTSFQFHPAPLNEIDRATIVGFEELFVSRLQLFDGSLLLQVLRNKEYLISCMFVSSVRFDKNN